MSRSAGLLAKLAVLIALGMIWAWPALATILEASQAIAVVQTGFTTRGWSGLADRFDDMPGSRSVIITQGGGGTLIDPASSAIASDRGTVARPIRLGLETSGLVLMTEALSLPIGILLAWLLFRSDVPGGRLILAILALAAFVPLPLHATAWLGAFGNAGRLQAMGTRPMLVGRFGAAVIHAVASLPWVVLLVGVGLRSVEPELEETARLDRASWWVAIHVTLRRGLGGIASAALAVAVLTAGDMTVTDLLQIRTYAEEAYLQSILGEGPASAAVVALPTLLVFGPLIILLARGLSRVDPRRMASTFSEAPRQRLGIWKIPSGLALFLLAGTFVSLPIYGLVWRAGRVGGRANLGRPPVWSFAGLIGTLREAIDDSWEPLLTSLVLSTAAASVATAVAWSLAWLCRRSWFWRSLTFITLVIGLAAPGPVTGMALKIAYRTWDGVSDSAAIVVLGLAARILPYAIMILWPAVRIIPSELFEVAAVSGYGAWGQIRRVLMPFSRRAAWATWAVAFALAMGELPATNLVLPAGITPISMRVWTLLHTGVESHLAGVTLVMLVVVAISGLFALAAVRSLARSTRAGTPLQTNTPL